MNRQVWFYAPTMNEASDRLRQLRIKRGFSTAAEAAKAFGWNEHTYKSHENGIRGIKLEAARKYSSAYGTSPAYILTGGNGADSPAVNAVMSVPVIARVNAGAFRYDEGMDEGEILVPVVPRADAPASSQYGLIVDGKSVNKRISDGAFAICVRLENYPGGAQHGQLVHVVRERAGLHEHTIKELRFTKDGPVLMPVSDDPRYQEPVKLSEGEDETIVRIHGVVIGSYQPL